MRDLDRAFEHRIRASSDLRDLVKIFDVVLEDEQIRRAGAGDADETLIVIFDHAAHFFVVAELHADGIFCSIRCFRYLISSNVCSGGRERFGL